MARRPNYKFNRLERQRAKAAKKAARLDAKKEKADKRKAENAGLLPAGGGLAPADDGLASPLGVSPGPSQEDGDPNP